MHMAKRKRIVFDKAQKHWATDMTLTRCMGCLIKDSGPRILFWGLDIIATQITCEQTFPTLYSLEVVLIKESVTQK